jgi:tetratricopeptide (TPR) repeat protein
MKIWWLTVTISYLGIASFLGVVSFAQKDNQLLAQTSELQIAQATQEASEKVEEVLELAHQSASKGQKAQASEFLTKALNLSQSIKDSSRRDELLIEIVAQFAEIGEDKQALAITRNKIKDINQQAKALLLLNDLYRLTGNNDKALQILQTAKAMVLDKKLDFRRGGIVAKYAEIGQYKQALELAKTLTSDYDKAEAGLAIARIFFNVGQYDNAFEVAKSMGVGFLDIPRADIYPGADLLVAIAKKYTQAGQYNLALEVTKAIPQKDYRISALRAIARQYNSVGQKDKAAEVLTEAFGIAKTWTPFVYDGPQILQGSNGDILAEIAGDYADIGQYNQAMQVIEAIGDKNNAVAHKAEALLKIASAYGRVGQKQQAAEILSQALELRQTIQLEYNTTRLLPIIAVTQAEAGQYDKAIQTTAAIADPTDKTKTLLEIASVCQRVGQKSQVATILSQAVQVAQTIKGESSTSWTYSPGYRLYPQRIETLLEIAQAYRSVGQKEQAAKVLSQALEFTQTIEDNHARSGTLAEIADFYRAVGQQEQAIDMLSQALRVAPAIASLDDKISALRHIADKYAAVGQKNKATEVLTQAIQVAKTLPKPSGRISKLTEIAQQQKTLNL